MRQIRLVRDMRTKDGVFGSLIAEGLPLLLTCEEEDQGNARSVSCIPAGTYRLKRTVYQKHGFPTYEVTGVPGRTRILFHPGNTEEDTMGCILPGMTFGRIWRKDEDTGKAVPKRGVLRSQVAFRLFMDYMAGAKEAELVVEWSPTAESRRV